MIVLWIVLSIFWLFFAVRYYKKVAKDKSLGEFHAFSNGGPVLNTLLFLVLMILTPFLVLWEILKFIFGVFGSLDFWDDIDFDLDFFD